MKYISFFLIFFLTACSSYKQSVIQTEPQELYSQILFVGKNQINGAFYNIMISCSDPWLQGLVDIPEAQTVEITLMENCKNQKIPKEILDTLTSKKFYYVYWDFYFQGNQVDNKIYQLDNEEAMKIGQAPWKIQAIEGVSREQAKIIRNTKNPIREAFEPTGNRDFYTEKESAQCDKYWKGSEFIQDEKIWRIHADQVLKCYRELPPMK